MISKRLTEPQLTTVRRLDTGTNRYNLIGTIQNQANDPVAVDVLGGPTKKEGQWIKKVIGDLPGESVWQFNDGEGNKFAWKVSSGTLETKGRERNGHLQRSTHADGILWLAGSHNMRTWKSIIPSLIPWTRLSSPC